MEKEREREGGKVREGETGRERKTDVLVYLILENINQGEKLLLEKENQNHTE